MTDDRSDDGLSELRAALSVKPSAGFAARVRAQVQRQARAWRRQRWPLVAAAIVIVGVTSGVMKLRHHGGRPTSEHTQATLAAPIETSGRSGELSRPRVVHRTNQHQKPEVLVMTDQARIIRRFWAGIREARIDPPPPEADRYEVVNAPNPTAAIAIPPIAIDPIVVRQVGGGAPEGQS